MAKITRGLSMILAQVFLQSSSDSRGSRDNAVLLPKQMRSMFMKKEWARSYGYVY